jgi:hypothetical protein
MFTRKFFKETIACVLSGFKKKVQNADLIDDIGFYR